jgi:Secretion system C-terminal sorting domain
MKKLYFVCFLVFTWFSILAQKNVSISNNKVEMVANEAFFTEHLSKNNIIFNDEYFPLSLEKEGEQRLLADTLYLQYDRINSNTFLCNSVNYFNSFQAVWVSTYFAKLAFVPGVYDILTDMRSSSFDYHIIIREQVDLKHSDTLFFAIAEAKNEISLDGRDEKNISFSNLDGSATKYYSFVFPENSQLISSSYSTPQHKTFHSGNFSDRFLLYTSNIYYDLSEEKKLNQVLFDPLYGLNESTIQQIPISEYQKQYLHLDFKPGASDPRLGIFQVREIILDNVWYVSLVGVQRPLPGDFWEGKFYITPNQATGYSHAWLPGVYSYAGSYPYYYGRPFEIYQDSTRAGYGPDTPNWVIQAEGNHFDLAQGAVVPVFLFENTKIGTDQARVYFGGNTVYFGINNEERREDILTAPYSLLDKNGNLLDGGFLAGFEQYIGTAESNQFLVSNDSYILDGKVGSSSYKATFDLNQEDANPPSLFFLKSINAEGLPSDVLRKDEPASLLFAASDYYWINQSEHWYPLRLKDLLSDSTQLFIKQKNATEWIKSELEEVRQDTINGTYYRADLSNFTHSDTGAYDAKIRIVDMDMNAVDYQLAPVFVVRKEFVGIEQQSNKGGDKQLLCSPNPFGNKVNFSFENKTAEMLKLTVYSHQGEIVKKIQTRETSIDWVPDKKLAAGIYYAILEQKQHSLCKKIIKL